jgi:hypothetical protein
MVMEDRRGVQKSEVGGQKSEVRSQKGGIQNFGLGELGQTWKSNFEFCILYSEFLYSSLKIFEADVDPHQRCSTKRRRGHE